VTRDEVMIKKWTDTQEDEEKSPVVWFFWPKLCERKWTCLVGRLYITNGLLSTIFKVCVFLWWILCEITQRLSCDRSPWFYLYDPRSGTHYSTSGWVILDLQLHLTPVRSEFLCCLLWINKVRDTDDKNYIGVSVWWKTKN
jgi:hypothetical protein